MFHWFKIHWEWVIPILVTVVVAVITIMLAIKSYLMQRSYIEFSTNWNVRRISDDKIRINEGIVVDSRSPTMQCYGTLEIGGSKIALSEAEFISNRREANQYTLVFDGQYRGAYTGQVSLKLKLVLGDKKSKTFKGKMNLSIPDKVNDSFKPPPDIERWMKLVGDQDN